MLTVSTGGETITVPYTVGPSNGVPAGTVLTKRIVSGDLILSATTKPAWVTGGGTMYDPFVIDAVDLSLSTGVVKPRGVTRITRSKIHTAFFGTTDTGVINCTSSLIAHAPDQVVIEDCDIYGDIPSWFMDGIFGHGWTARRCDIYHVQDGVGVNVSAGQTNAHVTLESPRIHDLVYFEGKYNVVGGNLHTAPSMSNDTSQILNPTGNPQKPDGSHPDGVQLQGGAHVTIIDADIDARLDMTVDANGSTPWVRKGTGWALNDPAGNGHSPWGTTNGNAALQMNNNQAGAPIDYVTVDGSSLRGGKFATVNWSAVNYGTVGVFTGHRFTNNRLGTPAGYTGGPLRMGALASDSPGYPLNLGSAVVDPTHITCGGNVMDADNTPAPWRAGGSTVIRRG